MHACMAIFILLGFVIIIFKEEQKSHFIIYAGFLLCCGTVLCTLFSDTLSFTVRPAKGKKSFLNIIQE